jgi:hypothetical protein
MGRMIGDLELDRPGLTLSSWPLYGACVSPMSQMATEQGMWSTNQWLWESWASLGNHAIVFAGTYPPFSLRDLFGEEVSSRGAWRALPPCSDGWEGIWGPSMTLFLFMAVLSPLSWIGRVNRIDISISYRSKLSLRKVEWLDWDYSQTGARI